MNQLPPIEALRGLFRYDIDTDLLSYRTGPRAGTTAPKQVSIDGVRYHRNRIVRALVVGPLEAPRNPDMRILLRRQSWEKTRPLVDDLRAAGATWRQVLEELQKRGILQASGHPWTLRGLFRYVNK